MSAATIKSALPTMPIPVPRQKSLTAAMMGLKISMLRVMPPKPGPLVKRRRNSGAGVRANSMV